MLNDLISVIMTSYNSNEKFLKKAIESVLNQTYSNFELIIVDDGSSNNALNNVISQMNVIDYRVKIIKQDNRGLCNARNTGIINSKGKYIAFIDDDDIWKKQKLELCYSYFKKIREVDSRVGMVFSHCEIIDENDKKYGIYGFIVKGNIYSKILGKNIIGPPSSVMISKDVLSDVGMFNSEYIYGEDVELWYRVTEFYNVYSINKPLIQYRYRTNSLSKNYEKMAYYTEKAIKNALDRNCDNLLNKSKILSKYYLDFAYLFFSNSNSKMFKKYYYKSISVNKINLINIKLLFGFIISLGGDSVMVKVNNFRRKDTIPPAYLKVYNCIDNEV